MNRSFLILGLLLILVLFLAPFVMAQATGWEIVHAIPGEQDGDRMGTSVASADLTGDGVNELIVGASHADPNGLSDAGMVYVYDGESGQLIYSWPGHHAGEFFGSSLCGLGDLDDPPDGIGEIIVGAQGCDVNGSNAGAAYVYSLYVPNPRLTLYGEAVDDLFGMSVSGAGMVNSGNVQDLAVSAPFADHSNLHDAGTVYIFCGVTGTEITRLKGEKGGDVFGWSICGSGDLDGDSHIDLIVGAPFVDPPGRIDAGSAYIYYGPSMQAVNQIPGDTEQDFFGWSVANAGHVDSIPGEEVIIGARRDDCGGMGNFTGSANVHTYDGGNWPRIHRFEGHYPGHRMGTSVDGAGDLDGDGFDDLIVGAERAGAEGSVYLFRGREGPPSNDGNGLLICRIRGDDPGGYFGHCVAGAGDVNRDGCLEILVGALLEESGGTQPGAAYLIRCQPTQHVFLAGINDDFNIQDHPPNGDLEFSSPAPDFEIYLDSLPGGSLCAFDDIDANRHFGHTFQQFDSTFALARRLPTGIIRAELEIRTRAVNNSWQTRNDTIVLGYDRLNGTGDRFWSSRLIDLPNASTWPTVSSVLDLDNLDPDSHGTTSILEDMETQGFLDVRISDDTGVDYMVLRVWTCQPQTGILTMPDPLDYLYHGVSQEIEVEFPPVGPLFDRVALVMDRAFNIGDITWGSYYPFNIVPPSAGSPGFDWAGILPPWSVNPHTFAPLVPMWARGRYLSFQAAAADWSSVPGPTYWYLSNTITAPVF